MKLTHLLPRRWFGLGEDSPYTSQRSAEEELVREEGERSARLETDASNTLMRLKNLLPERLLSLGRAMNGRRNELEVEESKAQAKIDEIEKAGKPDKPRLHRQSRWVPVVEVLILAVLETVMSFMVLGAFKEFADKGVQQWSVAALFGLLLSFLVFSGAKALAHVLKNHDHRHPESPHRMSWRKIRVFTLVVLCCIAVLPFLLTYARLELIPISDSANQQAHIAKPSGLNGGPEMTATTDTTQPSTAGTSTDDPAKHPAAVLWILALQLGTLFAGLAVLLIYYLQEDYRHYAELQQRRLEANKRLEQMSRTERIEAEAEITFVQDLIFAFFGHRERAAAEAEKNPPQAEIPELDREYWLKYYYSLTGRALPEDLVEEIQDKDQRSLQHERTSTEQGKPAEAEGQKSHSENGKVPTTIQIPPEPDEQHHY